MDQPINVKTMQELLEASDATPEFKLAVEALEAGRAQDRIAYTRGTPPVKVLRVLSKVLEQLPDEPIQRVEVQGHSGCSNFTGSLRIEPGNITVDFDWDCLWRAQERGWKDYFGDPDQIRAAKTFGYQCFADFRVSRPAVATE